jgi:hypothetical protein
MQRIARNFVGKMLLHRASICIPSREQPEKKQESGTILISKLLIQKNIGSDRRCTAPAEL